MYEDQEQDDSRQTTLSLEKSTATNLANHST